MSGELRPVWTTGKTLYAVVWNSAGQYAVGTTLEAFAVAHWPTYAVALTEIASSNGRYAGDFPLLSADVYTVEVYQRAGGSPSLTADGQPIAVGQIEWGGTAEVSLASRLAPTVAGRTLDVSSDGEAGIDWSNIGSPTASVNLSGTNISTTQDVNNIIGMLGNSARTGITTNVWSALRNAGWGPGSFGEGVAIVGNVNTIVIGYSSGQEPEVRVLGATATDFDDPGTIGEKINSGGGGGGLDPYATARLYGAADPLDSQGRQVFRSPPNADDAGAAKVRLGPTAPKRGGRTVELDPEV